MKCQSDSNKIEATVYGQTLRIMETADDAYGDLYNACNDLYESLLGLTGINIEDKDLRQNLPLNTGKAIGLTWAAMCIKDIMRTKRFMIGVTKAARECLMRNSRTPIHILYVGTGPFATLMLPLIAQLNPGEIQFTLLEVNENSFRCLQKLINILNLEKYVRRLENANGANWKLPAGEQVDIFLCENIQQGLKSEPQVAINLNIVPQLQEKTIIIPEEIVLRAALMNPKARMEKSGWKEGRDGQDGRDVFVVLEEILVLNKNTILEFQANGMLDSFSPVSITIDQLVAKTHPVLYALTEVAIYKEENLLLNESALTMPLKLMEIENSTTIQLQYVMGENPGVRVQRKIDESRQMHY